MSEKVLVKIFLFLLHKHESVEPVKLELNSTNRL